MYKHTVLLADGTEIVVDSDLTYFVNFADGTTDAISGFWLAKCELRTPVSVRR